MTQIKHLLKQRFWTAALILSLWSATTPSTVHAVIFTFSFDLADFLVSASGPAGPYTPANTTPGVLLTGTSAAPVLSIPLGSSFEIGMDISLTGANQFGLGDFQMGISDNNPTIAAVNASAGNSHSGSQRIGYGVGGNHGPTVNPFFVTLNSTGRSIYSDNAGGVDFNLGMYGANVIASYSVQTPYLNYGDQGPAELYNQLQIDTTGVAGTIDRLTTTNLNSALTYVISDPNNPGAYKNAAFSNTTDSIAPLPSLTVLITPSVPEPASIYGFFTIALPLLVRRTRHSHLQYAIG